MLQSVQMGKIWTRYFEMSATLQQSQFVRLIWRRSGIIVCEHMLSSPASRLDFAFSFFEFEGDNEYVVAAAWVL